MSMMDRLAAIIREGTKTTNGEASELEIQISRLQEYIKSLKDLRAAIFGGDTEHVVPRSGIILAIANLEARRSAIGMFGPKPIVPYVRKRAKPSLAYLLLVFDQLSQDTITQLTALLAKARKQLKQLKKSK